MADRGGDVTRLIVAGLGLIGARHAAHIAAHPSLELAAVVDPDTTRMAAFNAPGFATLEAVEADADGVVLATPTGLHLSGLQTAATRGWGALVEKPLAGTLEDGRRMVEIARASGIATLVGHHRRHHARVVALKSLLADRAIGTPLLAQMTWAMKKQEGYFDAVWRQGPEGSPVQINLVHEIDLLRHFLGEVTLTQAVGSNAIRGAERIESGAALLCFAGGATATIAFSDASPSPWGFEAGTGENPNIATTGQDYLHISGTEGAVSFPSLTLWSGAKDWSEAPQRSVIGVSDNVPLVTQLEHFAYVLKGAPPICDAEDGLKSLEATLAVEADILARGLAA